MDRRALETIALHQGMGAIAISDLRRPAVERKQGGELIEVAVKRHPGGAYTTAEMVALERDNIALMRAGLGQASAVAAAEEVARLPCREFWSDHGQRARTRRGRGRRSHRRFAA
jgi:hypothetical protein